MRSPSHQGIVLLLPLSFIFFVQKESVTAVWVDPNSNFFNECPPECIVQANYVFQSPPQYPVEVECLVFQKGLSKAVLYVLQRCIVATKTSAPDGTRTRTLFSPGGNVLRCLVERNIHTSWYLSVLARQGAPVL